MRGPFLEGAWVLIGVVVDEDQVGEGDLVDLVIQELHTTVTKDKVSTAWMTAGKIPRMGSIRRLPHIRMPRITRSIDSEPKVRRQVSCPSRFDTTKHTRMFSSAPHGAVSE